MSSDPPVGSGRQHIGISLRLAYEAFMRAVFERLAREGFDDLRPAHAQVFQHLKEEGVRLTDLALAAAMTPQSMGALVDDLERLGYVQREPDPSDRRAALIRPTDRGRAEVRAARTIIAGLERQWSRSVGEKRFGIFRDTLSALDGTLDPTEPSMDQRRDGARGSRRRPAPRKSNRPHTDND